MNPSSSKITTSKILELSLLILAGESIFFLPFVIARVFRPTFLSVFEITNLELGSLYSIYGIIAMVSYFFGGPLADRISPRILLAIALVSTAVGGFIMAFADSISYLSYLYGFWGLTTILLFWAALIKATRSIGGHRFQSRAFGFLEGGRGFIAAFVSTLAVGVFAYYLPDGQDSPTLYDQQMAFRNVIFFFSGWVAIVGLLIFFFMNKSGTNTAYKNKPVSLGQIREIANTPNIWFQAIIVVCAYVGYKVTDDFSLLAKEVLDFSDVASAQVGTLALWMRVVTAIIAGVVADKIGAASKVISWGFLLMVLCGLGIGSGLLIGSSAVFYIVTILVTCLGVYSVRGLYFTLIQEANISSSITGTTVGLISVIGFTPDIFMGPLMGYLLDENPGALGHQYVFLVLAGFGLIGWLANYLYRRTKPLVQTDA
ncbi:MAG: MFS transporter [Reichenbachiella sp.]|uniref:MFS transporter n=1 Tax=Reichenbachiella sp. TaxID=2184521 RepID=UPI0032667C0C